jgi:hypothetical protein
MSALESGPMLDKPATARRTIFLFNLFIWPVVLAGVPFTYAFIPYLQDLVPDPLGPLPLMVPWWGALGGLMISIRGVLKNRGDLWDDSYKYWHFARVPVSAAAGTIAYFIVLLVVPTGEIPPTGGRDLVFFYLVAFLAGYREDVFFALLEKLKLQMDSTRGRSTT